MPKQQYVTIDTYNKDNIIFSKKITSDTNYPSNKRIQYSYRYPNGEVQKFILRAPELFSFGVTENMNFNDKTKFEDYGMGFSILDINGATPEQERLLDIFNEITEVSFKEVLARKQELGKPHLSEHSMAETCAPMVIARRKKDKTTMMVDEKSSPSVFPKLLYSKKTDVIRTLFVNEFGEKIDPRMYIGVKCRAVPSFQIDNIFSGGKVSIMIKLYSVMIKPDDNEIVDMFEDIVKPKPAPEESESPPQSPQQEGGESPQEDYSNYSEVQPNYVEGNY